MTRFDVDFAKFKYNLKALKITKNLSKVISSITR